MKRRAGRKVEDQAALFCCRCNKAGGFGVHNGGSWSPTASQEAVMKLSLVLLGTLVASAAIGTRAEAQNYPWCAYYGGGMNGGGTNCGFTTYEQCMATVSGIGGFCDRNTQYVAPPGPRSGPQKKHANS